MLDGKPGDEAAARDGRLRGRHVPRRAALVQGGGRADLPHPAGTARPGVSAGDGRRVSVGPNAARSRRWTWTARRACCASSSRSRASTARRRRRSGESPRGCARPDSRPTSGRSTSTSSRATPTGATRSTATRRSGSSAGAASGRPAGRPRASTAGRDLLLNGHIDVVPVGDEAAWTTPPWDPAVRDGRVYGRGAVDMKGGLCCALFAAQGRPRRRRPSARPPERRQRGRRGGRRHRHARDDPPRPHRATAPWSWSRPGCAWSRRRRARSCSASSSTGSRRTAACARRA